MVGLVTLGSLVFDKPNLVTVDSEAPLDDVLSIMQKYNITYVLVESNGKYLGFVSTMELMTEVAFGMFEWDKPNPDDFQVFKSSKKPVKDLLKLNPAEQSIYCYEPTELLQCVFDPMSNGIRRILVSERDGGRTTYRSLSQFDVIRYIGSHLSVIKGQSPVDIEKTIKELDLCKNVDTPETMTVVLGTDVALQGFRVLALKNLVAAPVVDAQGKVITTLSASDLRGMASSKLKDVLLTATEFLDKARKGISSPVTCVPDDTLKSCLTKIITARVHRLWVVNDKQQPIGTLSVTDIIRLFKVNAKNLNECC